MQANRDFDPHASEVARRGRRYVFRDPARLDPNRAWVAAGPAIDEVWCPSSYVASIDHDAGFDPKCVAIVPLGVDTAVFSPRGPTLALPSQKSFRFRYVGGTIDRKVIDVLLAAYTAAFTASDDVTPIIKDFGAGDIYAVMNYRALIERITQTPGMPEILYIDATLSSEQLAALYRSAHARERIETLHKK